MAREFSGTAQYLSVSNAVRTAAPLSMACWFNKDATGSTLWLMSITDTGSTNHHFDLGVLNTNLVFAEAKDTAAGLASSTSSISANTWHHACGVWTSSSSRAAFLDGANKGTNGTGVTPSAAALDSTNVAVLLRSSAVGPWDGEIAWPCIWNVALSDAEVLALGNGAHPLTIRPGNIVEFWPLYGANTGSETGLIGQNVLTETGSPTATPSPLVALGWPLSVTRDSGAPPGGISVPTAWHHLRNLHAA